jgi:hypothetical protein
MMSMLKQYDFGTVLVTVPRKWAFKFNAVPAVSFCGPEHRESFTTTDGTYSTEWYGVSVCRKEAAKILTRLRTSGIKPKIS